jgi:uncharacterized protein (TIGR02145 family)
MDSLLSGMMEKLLLTSTGKVLRTQGAAISTQVEYGYLYNWYAATDARNIAPAGFHVPTDDEIKTMELYIGISALVINDWNLRGTVEGGKLKETGFTHWYSPNLGSTNEIGFNWKGSGFRNIDGRFMNIKNIGYLVSSDKYTREIIYNRSDINRSHYFSASTYGYPLRFIADSGTPTTVTGNDGKIYSCVTIGTQTWTAENSNETKYRDGSLIPEVTDNTAWSALTTGGRCSYNNVEANAGVTTYSAGKILRFSQPDFTPIKYGLLYNWYAATDVRGISSSGGWVVPSKTEWGTLVTEIGGETSGGKLKKTGTTHWQTPNTGATNEVGFNGSGGGTRNPYDGTFNAISNQSLIFSSTLNFSQPWAIYLQYSTANVSITNLANQRAAAAIRLLYTGSGSPTTYTGNDGKIYPVVLIGTQRWISMNLAETKYRDGSTIPNVTDNATWAALTTGACCAYNNDQNNV